MFTLHYMLPFLVGGTLCTHVVLLHLRGSGNSATVPVAGTEAEAFVVYYYKDPPDRSTATYGSQWAAALWQ